ncbi:hypothetical protein PoB_003689400 [Plakobranchus ocellatus]|uniref:Uncharacterized protein n=1 Tax=Plakobranchus ocellatus TaxID=259542 RepID=A0AAV4AVJ9_9GAST|nr:hypothetical protein PoB_003689400 [Plakobranchus ocellatus]
MFNDQRGSALKMYRVKGTPLWQIPVSSGEQWEYRLRRTPTVDGTVLRELQTYLKLSRLANKYEMILNRTLDLESIYDLYCNFNNKIWPFIWHQLDCEGKIDKRGVKNEKDECHLQNAQQSIEALYVKPQEALRDPPIYIMHNNRWIVAHSMDPRKALRDPPLFKFWTSCSINKKGLFHDSLLRTQTHQRRLAWARQHQQINRLQWQAVLFTDESRFNRITMAAEEGCGGDKENVLLTPASPTTIALYGVVLVSITGLLYMFFRDQSMLKFTSMTLRSSADSGSIAEISSSLSVSACTRH